ncbi:hypothetical protein [Synechococcus sp. CBW1004]|uniref:hypothetical protein n=1 Tax=Synechococcus sp. CBW1004 TaxID=1353136 RepID=UPI0018CE4F52|nr:hypothetical protein [Synechococcus sp. CBW1004]QPN61933.1 hypothetical protein H8F25_08955 [Synechococcus sp. CBW1004]
MSASAPGPPHRSGEGRPLRGIPRSRAFWELKAEQMMNRIFDPEDPIDLAVEHLPQDETTLPTSLQDDEAAARGFQAGQAAAGSELPRSAPPPPPPGLPSRQRDPLRSGRGRRATTRSTASTASARVAGRPDERLLLIGALCGVCLVSLGGSLLYFRFWNRLQLNLAQERNLLLLERLRNLGPANPPPVSGPEPAAPTLPGPAAQTAAGAEGLPPPPPQEAWIEQLSSLPSPAPTPPRVLTVPVSPSLAATSAPPARVAAASTRPAAPLPQLVGVVAGAGRAPSAIFLVGGSSMSVGSGELIGSTGWRLRSAEGETALLERDGELRQVSIASGNGF